MKCKNGLFYLVDYYYYLVATIVDRRRWKLYLQQINIESVIHRVWLILNLGSGANACLCYAFVFYKHIQS